MYRMKPEEQFQPSAMAQTGDGSQIERLSVSRIKPEDLLVVWAKLVPQIRRGLRKGAGDTLSERGLFRAVVSGDLDLWVVHDGSEIMGGLFLQIEKRERGVALVVLDVVAGTGRGLRDYAEMMLPRIREYGKMVGAYTIESVSRPGAARMLKSLGCRPKAIIMELSDGRQRT